MLSGGMNGSKNGGFVERGSFNNPLFGGISNNTFLVGDIENILVKVKRKLIPAFLNRFKQSKVYSGIIAEADM